MTPAPCVRCGSTAPNPGCPVCRRHIGDNYGPPPPESRFDDWSSYVTTVLIAVTVVYFAVRVIEAVIVR